MELLLANRFRNRCCFTDASGLWSNLGNILRLYDVITWTAWLMRLRTLWLSNYYWLLFLWFGDLSFFLVDYFGLAFLHVFLFGFSLEMKLLDVISFIAEKRFAKVRLA